MSSTPFSLGTRLAAAGALLLGVLLAVGALLPGTWQARSARVIPAAPEVVFGYLDGPEGWRRWTAWPDSGLVREGPERGLWASVRWNHPEFGQGSFEIVDVDPPRSVHYVVAVEEGALMTQGSIVLTQAADGTGVAWLEEGDFGWNPLMGYWALVMDGVQAREMDRGLERLAGVIASAGAFTEGGAR